MSDARGESAVPTVSHRVVTIPNALSALRLLLIPLFIWVALGPENDLAAFGLLAFSAVTDWLDGVIARRFNMVSRVGQLLDPIADRLFVVSTIVVLALRDIVPWWLVLVLVARDVVLFFVQLYVHRRGVEPLPVHYVGKGSDRLPDVRDAAVVPHHRRRQGRRSRHSCRLGVHRLGRRYLLVVCGLVHRAGIGCSAWSQAGVERVSSPSKVEPDASLSLLERLVDDAMDPGYQQNAKKADKRSVDWRHSVVFAAAIAITAALATAAVMQVRAGAPSDGRTRTELTERVVGANTVVEGLDVRLDELASEVERLRELALDGSTSDRALAEDTAALEREVGVAQ